MDVLMRPIRLMRLSLAAAHCSLLMLMLMLIQHSGRKAREYRRRLEHS